MTAEITNLRQRAQVQSGNQLQTGFAGETARTVFSYEEKHQFRGLPAQASQQSGEFPILRKRRTPLKFGNGITDTFVKVYQRDQVFPNGQSRSSCP